MTRILIALAAALSMTAHAFDGSVEKKTFALPAYTTVGGKTLKDVRVGYETYGKLNAAGDNAIFVPHFFSGTSHVRASTRRRTPHPATGESSSCRRPPTASSRPRFRNAPRFAAQGGAAEVAIIDGDGGHLDGVFNVAKQGEAIRAFLSK